MSNEINIAPSFFIETYGCQMNLYDSAKMRALLKENGWVEAREAGEADLVVINSCAVRQHAEERVLGRVAEFKRLKESRPNRKLILAGCVAQEKGRRLLEQFPHLDAVIGTEGYDCLLEIIEQDGGQQACHLSICRPDAGRSRLPDFQGRVTAMVAAMKGCDNFCSYCIVPYVRGRERSRPHQEILAEVRGLAAAGVREVTLVGQNVNSYHWGGLDFAALLSATAGIEGLSRLRFITSHPKDLGPKLLEAMASDPKICRHLHLPLQSGSDRILKLMNRGYTLAEFLQKVELARSLMPDLVLTSDIIVGFPGEGEEDFRQTLEAMRLAGFDSAYTYMYSPRPGTKAFDLPGQLPREVRLERLQILIALEREMALASNQREVGRELEVLVEGSGRRRGQHYGRSRGNKPVAFVSSDPLAPGRLVMVRIEKASAATLVGTLKG